MRSVVHTEFPPRFVAICKAAQQQPSSIAGLPNSCDAIERAIDAAVRAEKQNLPLPKVMPWNVCPERDMRFLIRRAIAAVRWCDINIRRLEEERDAIAKLLDASDADAWWMRFE